MNPGDLRHRITFQQYITGTSENGFPSDDWRYFTTVWAAKRGVSGREYYAAAAVQSENDVIYTIRYREDITSDMRIVEGEHIYDIKSIVDTDDHKSYLEIHAMEVVPGGS